MKKTTNLLLISMTITGVAFASAALALRATNGGVRLLNGDSGIVNHYARLEPTLTKGGHIEYWVDCTNHISYRDAECSEEIDNTDVSLDGNILPGDGRYLAPSFEFSYTNSLTGDIKISDTVDSGIAIDSVTRVGSFEYDEAASVAASVSTSYFALTSDGLTIDSELLDKLYDNTTLKIKFSNNVVADIKIRSNTILSMDWDVVSVNYNFGSGDNGRCAQDSSALSIVEMSGNKMLKYYTYGAKGLAKNDKWNSVQIFAPTWQGSDYYKVISGMNVNNAYTVSFDYEIVGSGIQYYLACRDCNMDDHGSTSVELLPAKNHIEYTIFGDPWFNRIHIFSSVRGGIEDAYMLIDNYKITENRAINYNNTGNATFELDTTGTIAKVERGSIYRFYENDEHEMDSSTFAPVELDKTQFTVSGTTVTIPEVLVKNNMDRTTYRFYFDDGRIVTVYIRSNTKLFSSFSDTIDFYGNRYGDGLNGYATQDTYMVSKVSGIDGTCLKYYPWAAQNGHSKGDRWNGCQLFEVKNSKTYDGMMFINDIDTYKVSFKYQYVGSDSTFECFWSRNSGLSNESNFTIARNDGAVGLFEGTFTKTNADRIGIYCPVIGGVENNWLLIDDFMISVVE